jgi:hypothetical protein
VRLIICFGTVRDQVVLVFEDLAVLVRFAALLLCIVARLRAPDASWTFAPG